jgi:GMP reductase
LNGALSNRPNTEPVAPNTSKPEGRNRRIHPQAEGKRILEPIKGKLAGTLVEMEQDVQSSISYSGGKKLMDIRKVNYVTLGGDNAGEHLLM